MLGVKVGWLALLTCLVLAGCGDQTIATPGNLGATVPASVPAGDWPTFDYNAQRTGTGPAVTGITRADLGALRTRVVHLDGTVDSSPIELHAIAIAGRKRDVIVVTTTYGRTIALAASTGQTLWQFTPADYHSYAGSAQVTTASPVADPDRRYLYAATPDGVIHKLSLATGREVRSRHWPVRITLRPVTEKIASALTVSGSSVVAVTGGYIGDIPPYQGHVVTIDRASGAITHVFNTLCSHQRRLIEPASCSASDSAIWARSGAVIEPGSHRILVATGNAPFNGATDWGDSVLALSPDAGRLLHNFTPSDQAKLNATDLDLGSTAPALLPGTALAVQGGKEGKLYLLDLNRLDGTTGPAGPRTGGQLQTLTAPGGAEVFTAPAVWVHAGHTYVFVADDSGTAAYELSGGRLRTVWSDSTAGTSPIVAGGLLYEFDLASGQLVIRAPATGAALDALAAAPGHWNSPIAVGGRIVLPVGDYRDHATTGTLYIYHLPGY